MTKLKLWQSSKTQIVAVVIVKEAVVTVVIMTSFSKNNWTPWQPMICSRCSFSRFSQCLKVLQDIYMVLIKCSHGLLYVHGMQIILSMLFIIFMFKYENCRKSEKIWTPQDLWDSLFQTLLWVCSCSCSCSLTCASMPDQFDTASLTRFLCRHVPHWQGPVEGVQAPGQNINLVCRNQVFSSSSVGTNEVLLSI